MPDEQPQRESMWSLISKILGAVLPTATMLAGACLNSPILIGMAIYFLIESKLQNTGGLHFYMSPDMVKTSKSIVSKQTFKDSE